MQGNALLLVVVGVIVMGNIFLGPDSSKFKSRVEIARSILYLPKYNLLSLLNANGIRVQNHREIDGFRDAWLDWLNDCTHSTFLSYHDAFNIFAKHWHNGDV